jgi:hypothetical protein
MKFRDDRATSHTKHKNAYNAASKISFRRHDIFLQGALKSQLFHHADAGIRKFQSAKEKVATYDRSTINNVRGIPFPKSRHNQGARTPRSVLGTQHKDSQVCVNATHCSQDGSKSFQESFTIKYVNLTDFVTMCQFVNRINNDS